MCVIMCFCMCAPICCRFQIFNIVVQFWVYAIVLDFSCSVCMLPIVSPGSILSRYQAVRLCMNLVFECVLKCFFVGGWVLPELQQICGVQFGSGTNPGGHVTFSFGATVIFCVDGPLECYATPTSHISGCVWVIGALQSGRIWFATTRATVFALLNWKICQLSQGNNDIPLWH